MSAKADLEEELGGDLPVLELVSEQDCEELLTMFRAARELEKQTLDESIDATLGALPRLFRGAARKIMFGGN